MLMKTIIITLVTSAFAFSVNAQQLSILPKKQPLKKFSFTLDSFSRNKILFKKPDSLTREKILFMPLDSTRVKPLKRIYMYADANIDNMPIARMPGNSNMPVVQTDRTAYNMPIAGINQPRVYGMTIKNLGANPEVLPFFGGKRPVSYEFKKYPDNTPPADNKKQ